MLSFLFLVVVGLVLESVVWAQPVNPTVESDAFSVVRMSLSEELSLILSQNGEVMIMMRK